ncbi:hypothetical protein V8C86DRAFT_2649875 [Haematococcus lacustris]
MGADAGKETILVSAIPLSWEEKRIRGAFAAYGQIMKIRIRRDEQTNAFKGSAYITFDNETAAAAAVSAPPQRLKVLLKSELLARSSSSKHPHSDPSAPYPSKRHATASQPASSQLPDPGLPGPPDYQHSSHDHNLAGTSSALASQFSSADYVRDTHATQAAGHSSWPPPPPHPHSHQGTGTGAGGDPRVGGQQANGVAEAEAAAAVSLLEQQVAKEQAALASLQQRFAQAQEALQEERAAHAITRRNLLAKEVEAGALKGEISTLRTQLTSRSEVQSSQYQQRILSLDNEVQQLQVLVRQLRADKERADKLNAVAAAHILSSLATSGAASKTSNVAPEPAPNLKLEDVDDL